MFPFPTRTLASTAPSRLYGCKLQRLRSSSLLPYRIREPVDQRVVVSSKTHVTPVKGVTIPSLELQAAVEGLNIALTICPADLRSSSTTASATASHRNTGRRQWRHVTGDTNPADLCSPGIDPKDVTELINFHKGPPFLNLDTSEWYTWEEITEPEERDVNVIRILAVKTEDENHVIDRCVTRFSSLLKLQWVLAWSKRCTKNARAKLRSEKLMVCELTAEEMVTSLVICIKRTREFAFTEELYALRKNLELPLRSKLRIFKPFLDEVGQLRVGGRVLHAPNDYATKHPILLPATQLLTRRIIWDYHIKQMHVKTERLLTDLHSRY
ncbi:uncharacterized protein LOC130688542 [Daphnia carinata]|uniref:uncharacterized protein LOC130688542 n=1 Tax=Daphnia carinata TaxID=120202 RepID=UPI00257F574A|nr:uncharacterized protein LOC130688542 [Daphnia carinata]